MKVPHSKWKKYDRNILSYEIHEQSEYTLAQQVFWWAFVRFWFSDEPGEGTKSHYRQAPRVEQSTIALKYPGLSARLFDSESLVSKTGSIYALCSVNACWEVEKSCWSGSSYMGRQEWDLPDRQSRADTNVVGVVPGLLSLLLRFFPYLSSFSPLPSLSAFSSRRLIRCFRSAWWPRSRVEWFLFAI